MIIESLFYRLITGRNLVDDASTWWARRRQRIKQWQVCQTNPSVARFVGSLMSRVDEPLVQMKRLERAWQGKEPNDSEMSVVFSEEIVPVDASDLPDAPTASSREPNA